MKQSEALTILKTGANVFLTGEPGSGKTHTVNQYIKYLKEHGIGVAVTASTGIAATHLSGMTIHSWSGIGIKKNLSAKDLESLRDKRKLGSRMEKTSVLIIDEISMLDAETLSAVNTAICALRYTDKPFGGMQVVFVGDFFQLPPVSKERNGVQFAFESPAWKSAKPVVCYLSEQHRQQDINFLSVLSSIRSGLERENVLRELSLRKINVKVTETVTRLYSHNNNVDTVNQEKLDSLSGETHVYNMSSQGRKSLVEQLKKSCLSPVTLALKKGASVMFTKNNFEEGFVNGTLGEVIGFEGDMPIVKTKSGKRIEVEPMEWEVNDGIKILASITQLPLRLAWAITIHKSQGMTLDAAVMDLSSTFEYGQGYVAISRVKSFSGLFLLGLNKRALEVHPEIIEADISFREKSKIAEETLLKYSDLALTQKHKDFILKSGGTLEKTTPKKSKKETPTYDQTLELYKTGKNLEQIAKERNLKRGTIISHLEKLKEDKKLSAEDLQRITPLNLKNELSQIHKAFTELGIERLAPIFSNFNGKYSYDKLKLARLLFKNTI